MIVVVTVFVVLTLMILWGRAQREERDRVHLRKVVNEVPVFENTSGDGYSSLLADFSGGYAVDHLLRDDPATTRPRR